ncbi:DUF427 domain-containing protein [Microlunatus flavus]|uniref:Uncharacterized conserved protein, DUF427 family n=1 Tax=Microlunatus flavus TaxID=1036181 RepID=A0A1H9KU08_9ACTN|nr:DUF427 domain-containing protein [Microlunatus flavus]SER02620.1 Uncharacterized conserved protein, DUF427 family [Microlunatus flavus]
MRTETVDKRVRARVGGTVVVDARGPLLVWEDHFPIPAYAFESGAVTPGVLRETAPPPAGPWSFHGPQGPVVQWFDLVVGNDVVPHAAWRRDDPAVAGLVVLSWDPALPLRWTEEDEEVAGHPRDPHHRVEVLPSSRHVVVRREGVVLAESSRPVLLLETGLPTRYYLPESDVALERLQPSATQSFCPYKGVADRYFDVVGQAGGRDLVWSYSDPKPAVGLVAGRLAFYDEHVDVTVDGVDLPRPESPFSARDEA